MPCDVTPLSEDETHDLIDWEQGIFPGCPLPFSPGLCDINAEDQLAWRLYQEAKVLTWDTIWQLTTLHMTRDEADRFRERLVFIATYEQQCLREHEPNER